MSISQYTLALIAMCLNQAYMAPEGWDVSVASPVQALQGMSVIFNCSFQYPYKSIPSSDITALWLEDPCTESSEILYNSKEANSEGVSFIGDLDRKNCSLQLHDVKKTNKNYCFRFKIQGRDSWTGKPGVNLIVYAHPTKPILSVPPELIEGVRTKLICSSSEIDEQVQSKLEWYGLGDRISGNIRRIPETRTLQSTVTVTLSHRDHNKVIKCSVISSKYSFRDEVQVTLKVKYAPQNITIQGENRSEIKEGDEVFLSCASNSNPEATYSWYRRDKGQVQDFTSKDGILLFQSISQRDSGFYSCTATNYLGNQTSEAVEISVQYAPRNVKVKMENRSEIKEGDEVSLSCASNSNPEATYSWYKRDKVQIQDYNSNDGILLFQSISQSDSGFYSCMATNYLGNQSSEAVEISVQYAPKNVTIQVEARSQLKIKEGDKISLSCASNSNPEATYSWYKRDNGQVQDFTPKDGILLFQSISQSDSGFYGCTATNYLGSQSSEAVEISVQYAPKNVNIKMENRSEIKEGDEVSLSCAGNSNPEATYSWYKRDKGQVQDYNSNDGILLFQSISQSNAGLYSCVATNYLGRQSSEAVEILVQYAPRNTTIYVEDRTEMDIKEGDNISLLCSSRSYPEATYTWYRRNKDNSHIINLNSTRGTLVFHSISRSNSGLYTCTASNYLGKQTSEDWKISVQYKPTQVNLTQGGMSFHCITEANPPARISWNNTETAVEVQNGSWTISILTLQTMTSGCVSCQAQNKLGVIRSEEYCFKSTLGAILPTVIAGSIVATLLLFAIWLWRQKKYLFRGKNLECDSQPVIHTEMQDLTEITQTSNSVISGVYDNLFMSKSGERKWKFSRKNSGNSLHYASLQFAYKHKGRKAARPNSEQAELGDAQVTPSSDSTVYENMAMFKTDRKKPGVVGEESTVYACVKTDNLQDN
ncbi:B-cell receptor CD22-like isoform X2 [Mobula birostris]|uniref:B-cell receptor CD22-like isoform X2 n=1 Tax=Mobula birostris TaxID=1983395 RepID=UPI003B2815A5